MNKRINVYEDGKMGRAIYAEIIDEDKTNDRFLIKFTSWEDEDVELWFYRDNLNEPDGMKGHYTCYDEKDHWNTNYWYFPIRETYDFALECSEYLDSEYWNEYFSHLVREENYGTI